MNIHPVDSKKTMLSPQDIFVVASHEYKEAIRTCKHAAHKVGITPERLVYTILLKEYSDPRLIRIRSGNTLFTIAAFAEGVGFVSGYNGDTAQNYVENILDMSQAAKKMGFKLLLARTTPVATKAVKLAIRKHGLKGIKASFDEEQGLLAVAMEGARNG